MESYFSRILGLHSFRDVSTEEGGGGVVLPEGEVTTRWESLLSWRALARHWELIRGSDTVIGTYKITEPWKYFEKSCKKRVGYISAPPFRRWTIRRRTFWHRDYSAPELFFLDSLF